MRRKRVKTGLAILLGAACIGGTAAYFTDFDKAENRIAVGVNTTEIGEEFPDVTPDPEEPRPEYKKTVWVTNVSQGGAGVDCYVRLALSYSDSAVGEGVELRDLDRENWIYNEADGFYYYRHVLLEGERTTPLFTGFSIDKSKIDETFPDEGTEFSINVYEESIQAETFGDYRAAWKYYQSNRTPAEKGGDVI